MLQLAHVSIELAMHANGRVDGGRNANRRARQNSNLTADGGDINRDARVACESRPRPRCSNPRRPDAARSFAGSRSRNALETSRRGSLYVAGTQRNCLPAVVRSEPRDGGAGGRGAAFRVAGCVPNNEVVPSPVPPVARQPSAPPQAVYTSAGWDGTNARLPASRLYRHDCNLVRSGRSSDKSPHTPGFSTSRSPAFSSVDHSFSLTCSLAVSPSRLRTASKQALQT